VPALFRAAQATDAAAHAVLARASATVALAVANMCAVVDPELVVVGGGLARGSDVFLEAMRRTLGERLPNAPRVIRTVLAERAAVLGAGAVALDWFSGVPIFAGGVAG